MKPMYFIFSLFSLIASVNLSAQYFYCVTTNNYPYQINPSTHIKYRVISHPLVVGQSIKLGDYYSDYKVNENDVSGGNFKSLAGFGTPYGYFIYPTETKHHGNIQILVSDLINQCKNVIKNANRPGHEFKEVRVSESVLSGTGLMQSGYPLVYLNTPTRSNQRNIFRVNVTP